MKYALWYNQKYSCWYLLDWSQMSQMSDGLVLAPFAVASDCIEPTSGGGFRWNECGGVLLFDSFPIKECKRILKNKLQFNIKPKLGK